MSPESILEQFLREIKRVVPSQMKKLFQLINVYVTHPEIQSPDERAAGCSGLKYVFNLASGAMESTFGWRGIPKWQRQLFIPALITWWFGRRAEYLRQREKLIIVKDAWTKHEAAVKLLEESTNGSKDNVDTRDSDVPGDEETSRG